MGFFDRFKKKERVEETSERLENFPEMLNAKLLFFDKPILNPEKILEELKFYFDKVDNPQNTKHYYTFSQTLKLN